MPIKYGFWGRVSTIGNMKITYGFFGRIIEITICRVSAPINGSLSPKKIAALIAIFVQEERERQGRD